MLKIKVYGYKLLLLSLAFCLLPSFLVSARPEHYTLTPLEIEDGYHKATSLVNQGYSRKAIALWQELLPSIQDPNLKARIHLNLTITYVLRGDLHLAAESYQEAKKYALDTMESELLSVKALMALAAKDWEEAIALYSTLNLQNLTILNNLINSYQGRGKQRQKLALTARWEEDEEQEQYWLALAREDELKARQLRPKAVEIASQEISLDAAKVFLRELQAKNTQKSAGKSLQELSTENIQESPRKNLGELSTDNTQKSLREKAVSVLQALEITEESILLMVEVAKLNGDYWAQTEEMATKWWCVKKVWE